MTLPARNERLWCVAFFLPARTTQKNTTTSTVPVVIIDPRSRSILLLVRHCRNVKSTRQRERERERERERGKESKQARKKGVQYIYRAASERIR